MHPEDGLPTDLTRTASKPHLHDFGSAFEESIRVGDYLYEIYGSEPEKSPFPPARPYLQDVCPVQIYRNFPTACHYRKSHARKGPSAAETPLGCAEASTDGASCGGRGTVSIHPGGRAAFSVQRSSPLLLLAPKAAYAATSEQRARTAARPRSRASRISGINRFGWIGRVGWVCWIVGVVRAQARRCGRRAGRRRRGARHARMQRIRSLDEEVDLPFNQNARATLGARLLFARRQSNGVKRR